MRRLGEPEMIEVAAASLLHLPPHLRDVCHILALGLVRLRCRTAEDFHRDLEASGETSLHFTAPQSVHADPLERTSA